MVDKTFLFRVEVSNVVGSRFEPSYGVKRLTNDPDIMNKFIKGKDMQNNIGDAGFHKGSSSIMPNDGGDTIAQDLLPKLSWKPLAWNKHCGFT